MMLIRKAGWTSNLTLLFAVGMVNNLTPIPVGAQTAKPATADNRVDNVDASQLPKAKQTSLGLYVTAAEAYEMWKASPDKVKVIDVRTPEEFAFVGHPVMAWNIPIAFVSYQRKDRRFEYKAEPNKAFVELVKEIAEPSDVLLVTCRSGGRSAIAVNQLASAGFSKAYNIVDGVEGDLVQDPESVFNGKRMKNGWKNSAPWGYGIDPEKVILEETSSEKTK
jgi:rhodanese-related sulfurtransferase